MQVNNITLYSNTTFNANINKRRLVNNAYMCSATSGLATQIGAFAADNKDLLLASSGLFMLSYLFMVTKHLFVEKPLELASEIEFKKAQTLEEAENFAKENFKIKKFQVDDLEIANWINEGLSVLSNKFKGKVYMPSKIVYGDINKKNTSAYYRAIDDCLKIGKVSDVAQEVELAMLVKAISETGLEEIPLGNGHEQFLEDMNNYKKLTKFEKCQLAMTLVKILEVLSKYKDNPDLADISDLSKGISFLGPVYCGRFGILFHEMGHVFDKKSRNDWGIKQPPIFNRYRKKMILPKYAASNFTEFVAEIFAGVVSGEKFPDIMMQLFSKVCNIKLPNN